MRFTLSWLKKFLDTEASVSKIAQSLTALGLEVEEVIDKGAELSDFEVAYILNTRPHPNASKLQICEVETQAGILQIVCGASNARAQLKVVLAKVGCRIPKGNFKIKESVIRGEKSCGMLCSEAELLLGPDSEGIIELPSVAKVGESFIKYYGLDDPVFNVNVTPNRGDALGVYGIARDLAAYGLGKLKELELPKIKETFQSNLTLQIQDKTVAALFCLREIRNVQNRASPDWLKRLLQNIGVKSVSAIVDVMNYILYSFGQPMHAYDRNKFLGNIRVGLLQEKTKFIALNGKEYVLEENDLIIHDNIEPQAIAGIIGGSHSSCSSNTQNIIVEAACFSPIYITRTGRRLQIETESRYRFERNIDQAFTMKALNIATEMIVAICGGEVSQVIYEGNVHPIQKSLEFPVSCFAKITGMHLSLLEIRGILERLGFILSQQDSKLSLTNDIITILVPSWRHDIKIKEDIVEEIMRVYGYEQITSIKLPPLDSRNICSEQQRRIGDLRRVLASCGYDEVVTNSFMCGKIAQLFTEVQEDLFLLNPISLDNNYMRPSIIPNLLKIAQKNLDRSIKNIAVMEVGPVFNSCTVEGELLFASGIKCGDYNVTNYHGAGRLYDIFDIKSDLEIAFSYMNLKIDNCQFAKGDLSYYHPARSSVIRLGNKIIAWFGQVHPNILKYFGIKEEVFAFEINIANIPFTKSKFGTKAEFFVSDFPATCRDYAFVIDIGQPVGELITYIKSLDKKIIKTVDLFDVYSGEKLPLGKKSVAIKVQFQADDRTLNESDLSQLSAVIILGAKQKFQATLRE
ncbi:phenylalanine--tRNA ligase subunit beta [Candidatus Tisiphia endosymbiont of Nemotelus uliginosus]|uniref:phenylalanine--tRNA ligase subunit beta n=1 Tax=Candidatus Tisiphia endosymbiont of Nemotelus uliginosus TaxID=3077926 RepID=UPI0035C8E70D